MVTVNWRTFSKAGKFEHITSMASWKSVGCILFVILGVITFIHETEAERLRKTKLAYTPPRIRDYINIRNELIERPGHKRKKLRSEIIAAGNKLTVNVPNPPVVLHHVLEYWPYNRVYVTSVFGIFNYIRKILWIVYKVIWIFIDMFILIVKIIFQATEVGKLKVSYDLLNKPSTNPYVHEEVHYVDDHNHDPHNYNGYHF